LRELCRRWLLESAPFKFSTKQKWSDPKSHLLALDEGVDVFSLLEEMCSVLVLCPDEFFENENGGFCEEGMSVAYFKL